MAIYAEGIWKLEQHLSYFSQVERLGNGINLSDTIIKTDGMYVTRFSLETPAWSNRMPIKRNLFYQFLEIKRIFSAKILDDMARIFGIYFILVMAIFFFWSRNFLNYVSGQIKSDDMSEKFL